MGTFPSLSLFLPLFLRMGCRMPGFSGEPIGMPSLLFDPINAKTTDLGSVQLYYSIRSAQRKCAGG